MALIEWFFLGWFVLGAAGGIYFLTQGGFHTSTGERAFNFVVVVALLTWLLFSGPLTWFGWALVAVYVYDLFAIPVKAYLNPGGSWSGDVLLIFDTIISVVCIILILTVGVVA